MHSFFELTPVEAALLWIAPDFDEKNGGRPTVLASKSTLILVCLLAEWAARSDVSVLNEALNTIEDFSGKMTAHIAERGEYVRYDQPIRIFLDELSNSGFSILGMHRSKEEHQSLISKAYRYGQDLCETSLLNLERQGLLVDPPWYKSFGIGVLVVLLGSVPLEINIKTTKGRSIVQEVSIKANLWDYESTSTKELQNVHINLKVSKFIEAVIDKLGKGFMEAWQEQNPVRNEILEKQETPLLDNNSKGLK